MSSRSFAAASNQFLRKLNMPIGARTLAGWGKTDVSGVQIIMICNFFSGIPPVFNTSLDIGTVPTGVTNNLAANITDTSGSSGVVSTNFMVINTWFHWAVTIDATNINVYLNGVRTSAAYVETLRNWPRHSISTSGSPFNGQIAHVATWNIALRDEEILALCEGRCPPMDVGVDVTAPARLLYYAPLEHDDLCQFGEGTTGAQLEFTPQNSPTFSDEDPNVYPMVGGIVAA